MDTVLQDLRYALRTLAKSPGFAAVAVVTLALAIGANTAMFSVTNGVLLRPLPVQEQERLVLLQKEAPWDNSLRPFSVPDLAALQEQSRVLEAVAGVQYDGAFPYPVREGDRAMSVQHSMVSGEFFRVLSVRPAAGRLLEPADAAPGAEPVVVISHGLWQRQFGGDSGVVGRTIRFNFARTIVGIAPRGFEYPQAVEAWVPVRLTPEVVNGSFSPFSIIGRLRSGATVEQAQGEAAVFVRERETVSAPGETRGQRAVVVPFRDAVIGNLRQSVAILTAAVVLVLVVACVNVTNLLLIRGVARERELAVRVAMGAAPGRIGRQLLVESGLLAAGGGLLGVVLASWLVIGLVAVAPPELPRLADVRVDGRVLLFALALSTVSTLLFGLAPAMWTARSPLHATLRGGARGGGDSRRARVVKQALVVGQVALALVVVAGAGLLTKSLMKLQRLDIGLDTAHLTFVKIAVPGMYGDPSRLAAVFERLAERLEATPGIAATPVNLAPFSGAGGWNASVTAEGQETAAAENPTLNLEFIAPNYFRTLDIRLQHGREFTAQDREGSVPVAIVGDATALRLWPGQDPLRKRLKFGGPDSPKPWLTVVGVVDETRYRDLTAAPPGVYIPFRQALAPGQHPTNLAVRSTASAEAVGRAVRSVAAEVEPTALVLEANPWPRLLAAPLARPRFNTLLLTGFSLIALVLAAVGLYAVMAAVVSQRTHEIGVRLALGAQARNVRRLVLAQGMRLALIGAALGVFGAVWAGRALTSVLYEVSPTDATTLFGGAMLLLGAAALACALPARRATKVDPMVALRTE